jgi:cytochrome c oxidase subunit 2
MDATTPEAFGLWLPPDISVHGAGIDQIINLMHWFMLFLFVGWAGFLIFTLIKFRARPGHKADYYGVQTHATSYLEAAIVVVEVVILVGLSIPVWAELKSDPPEPSQADVTVRVVGEQFAWNVHYPGADNKFGKTDASLVDGSNPLGIVWDDVAAKDDIATINQFHFPVGKKVLLSLTSKDVIHSFWMNIMRVKQDAIPGNTVPLWFEAKQTGKGEISCAQLCGLGHYRMKGFFSVDTDEEYAAWLAEQAKSSAGGADDYY